MNIQKTAKFTALEEDDTEHEASESSSFHSNLEDIDTNVDVEEELKLQKKATFRIMPIVYLLFFFAFLDRANLANMHEAILEDIPMSETEFGFALGIFYISYVIFQLPANVMLQILKPKKWIAIISFAWGLVTLLSVTISSVVMLSLFRFILGLTEAGLAPALMLYIRIWFGNKYRAQAISIFMMSIPASNFVSGLISGFVISATDGAAGLSGWQWLYLVEGVPTIAMGIVVLYLLPNSPAEAKFLTHDERFILQKQQESDAEMLKQSRKLTPQNVTKQELLETITAPRNWLLSFIGLCMMISSAGVSGFLPSILYEFGNLSKTQSNLLSSVPNFIALFFLYYWSRRSDQKGERLYHISIAIGIAIFGLLFCAVCLHYDALWPFLVAAIIYNFGFWAGSSIFLTHGVSSVIGSPAIGIALLNSVYTSGGWVGPFTMGVLRDHTGNHVAGLLLCCGSLTMGIGALFLFQHLYVPKAAPSTSSTSAKDFVEMSAEHDSEDEA